jgi:hypothetical protein
MLRRFAGGVLYRTTDLGAVALYPNGHRRHEAISIIHEFANVGLLGIIHLELVQKTGKALLNVEALVF